MTDEAKHQRVAVGLMHAALAELIRLDLPGPVAHLQRAIDSMSSPTNGRDELPADLAALVFAIPLSSTVPQADPAGRS